MHDSFQVFPISSLGHCPESWHFLIPSSSSFFMFWSSKERIDPEDVFQELVSRVTLSLHCSKDADDRSNGFSPDTYYSYFRLLSRHWNFADWTPVLGTHINYLLRRLWLHLERCPLDLREAIFSGVTAMGCRILTAPHCLAYVLNRDLAYLNIWGSWSYRRSRTYMLVLLAQTMQSTLEHPYFWQPRELLASLWHLYPGHPTILYSRVVDTIMGLVCDNRDSIDNSRSE
jgi:hypothetical protein